MGHPVDSVSSSLDLFGTLVRVDRPTEPAWAVARELRRHGVAVPDDWATAYATSHLEVTPGTELPLPTHVVAALESRGIDADAGTVRRAVCAAFDPTAPAGDAHESPDSGVGARPVVETRVGVDRLLSAARARGPVAICSNCSVPGLVRRTLLAADLGAFDAVVTSVGCGWRKPAAETFEITASRLGIEPGTLVHVGDDPRTDGGVESVGGRFLHADGDLTTVADRLAAIDHGRPR